MDGERRIFIERVKRDKNGFFIGSEIEYPTPEQEAEFRAQPCNEETHSLHVDKLCYDEPGWPYDLRHCAKCGVFLGGI
jgi:hypothetical protein